MGVHGWRAIVVWPPWRSRACWRCACVVCARRRGFPSAAMCLVLCSGRRERRRRVRRPSGVAVDEATGEVYVVDAGNERVEVFRPGADGYEYFSQFKVRSPGAIAVDNSTSTAILRVGTCMSWVVKKKASNRLNGTWCTSTARRKDASSRNCTISSPGKKKEN